jgi:hypothetical protein
MQQESEMMIINHPATRMSRQRAVEMADTLNDTDDHDYYVAEPDGDAWVVVAYTEEGETLGCV